MRIIMLNNIYKHYLEIIFKIRKKKEKTIWQRNYLRRSMDATWWESPEYRAEAIPGGDDGGLMGPVQGGSMTTASCTS